MKSIKALALVTLLSTTVVAATLATPATVNKSIKAVLSQFKQEKDVKLNVKVSKLELTEDSVTKLAASGTLNAKGKTNKLTLKADGSYKNDGKGNPETQANVNLKLDLVKLIGEKYFEETVSDLAKSFNEMLKDNEEYGDALSFSTQSITHEKTTAGKTKKLTAKVRVTVDSTKLPPTTLLEDLEFTDVSVDFVLTPTSLVAKLKIAHNPAYYGYSADTRGLRDFLVGLANLDEDTLEEATDFAGWAISLARLAVNYNAEDDEDYED